MTTINGLPIYELSYDDNFTPTLQLALVDYPAIEVNWQKFGKQMRCIANEEQRIIFGPAMVPDIPIYRCDEAGEYYITFSADTIAKVAKSFVVGCHFNLMHDAASPADCTLVESYLLNAGEGKTAPDVFGTLPDGTWMVKAHIEDDALWADVKAGIYRGFSIESFFNFTQMKKTQKLWRRMFCASIVAKHNDEDVALQFVEDEFAEGIAVYILDETGALVPAPDGEYIIEDVAYIVTDGIITLKPEDEEAPEVVEETPAEEVAAEGEEETPAEVEETPAAPDFEERFAALEARIAAVEEALAALLEGNEGIMEEMKKIRKRNCEMDALLNSLKEVKALPVEHQSMRSQAKEDRLASLLANRK